MEIFPPVPLAEWKASKETLHRFAQVVGKIRLAGSVRRNHWWNVPYHVTGSGITTRPMGLTDGNPVFTIDFDFVGHRLVVRGLDGSESSFSLLGQSVSSFHRRTLAALHAIGVEVTMEHPHPFDLPDGRRPFAEDTEHAAYDPFWVNRYWQVLSQVGLVLEAFSAGYSGKVSPVHHFWHTFDIAVTRFSDRKVEQGPDTDPVTREAYSREVISAGFWFGDDAFPRPTFYSYAAPEPEGLADEPLLPEAARWVDFRGGRLAVLDYDDVRGGEDAPRRVLDFYESVYRAAARRAGWDVEGLACPGGVTDPVVAGT
ncbi:hypothetical protein BLA24_13940 [Streptomyces cinnamoneus]|uniref:Ava_C0101 and related proteins n=1 Tax=Streptomyces cinnamoneus TaxID=53446 RepID=A0A2G1XJK0_STRCJ|nr:DUF5996 family protein [Streptomyces cinnamoneus]PHQ51428.1 hypothetical protein BLA24_13940 [Streptomyces cinnamoneus]PPT11769.1 hypothetical protein CYQ11_01635 [Streptomyces cinnamoneus]